MKIKKWKKRIRKQIRRNQNALLMAGVFAGAATLTAGLIGAIRRGLH